MTRRPDDRMRAYARLFQEVLTLAGRQGWRNPEVQSARRAAFEGLRGLLERRRTPFELEVTPEGLDVDGRPLWRPANSATPRRLHDSGVSALRVDPAVDSGQFCRLLRWLDALGDPLPAGEGPITLLWSLRMEDVRVRLADAPPTRAHRPRDGSGDSELARIARAADRRLEELDPRQPPADPRPGLVSDELAEQITERLGAEASAWRKGFGQMIGSLWLQARQQEDSDEIRSALRRLSASSLRLQRHEQLVHDLARAVALLDRQNRQTRFVTDALTPAVARQLFETLLPDPGAACSPAHLRTLEHLGRLAACLPEPFAETVLEAFQHTSRRGRECLLGFVRREFDRNTARLQEAVRQAPEAAAIELLDESLRHRREAARQVLRAGLEHPHGEVRVHALECLEFAPLDLVAPLDDVPWEARARARHEVLEIAQTRRRSDLVEELCERTTDRNFAHRPLAKRAALLEALAAAAPCRAVQVASDWVDRVDLFPSRDLTDTRIMAARLLEALGGDQQVLEVLDRAATFWWWNPKLLRKQARSTADKLRAQH